MAFYKVEALIESYTGEGELGFLIEESLMFLSETSVLKDLNFYEVSTMPDHGTQ